MSTQRVLHADTCSCTYGSGEWYRRYAPMIRQFILSRTHDSVAADDCTSETFLRAHQNAGMFHCGGQGVRPWLVTIARNIARDYRKRAYVRLESLTDVTEDWRELADSPEQVLLAREARAELSAWVSHLPPDQATCVQLRFFEELSVRETARVMRRADTAVRALQHRAVRNLAAICGDERVETTAL